MLDALFVYMYECLGMEIIDDDEEPDSIEWEIFG
jgi:hypothetical protein